MAIVLALVIFGWLIAFALGSQAGFNNEPTVVTEQAPVTELANTQPVTYREPASVS